MTERVRFAAVDLGATSGRVMAATVGRDRLELAEVRRFPNAAVRVRESLFWDVLRIHQELLNGLAETARTGPLDGIGIDSWAVDHGLLDDGGRLLGNPYSHRDSRTTGVMDVVAESIDSAELYSVTGLQQLPFNTLYQLVADRRHAEQATTLLLLPDLLGYWLTGVPGAERTNASTTQLYDVRRREWATELMDRVGLPTGLLPPLRDPGDVIGPLLPEVADEIGTTAQVPVIAVGSHDTASAVVAVPAEADREFAYISSGTWSLVGLELDGPVLTEASRIADFTNEAGVDGTIRYLKNVMGLWLLSESMRAWAAEGHPMQLSALLESAAEVRPGRTLVDVDHPSLLPPGDLPGRIAGLAAESGEPIPGTPGELTRCILDSLALAYRRTIARAAELSGRQPEVVHIVGGGVRNRLLCQLTADACGLPVVAGPTEAAALGNALVGARTLGVALPDLASMRELVRRTAALRHYRPTNSGAWERWESRVPDHGLQ